MNQVCSNAHHLITTTNPTLKIEINQRKPTLPPSKWPTPVMLIGFVTITITHLIVELVVVFVHQRSYHESTLKPMKSQFFWVQSPFSLGFRGFSHGVYLHPKPARLHHRRPYKVEPIARSGGAGGLIRGAGLEGVATNLGRSEKLRVVPSGNLIWKTIGNPWENGGL